MRKPDFEHNLQRILNKQKGERATLFELFLNNELYQLLAGHPQEEEGPVGGLRLVVEAMAAGGYDYASCHGSDFVYPTKKRENLQSRSMSGQGIISDWETFEQYRWPDPASFDCSRLEKIRPYLPEGMKLMVYGPGGILENAISIVGYDQLCFMLYEDPDLAEAIFTEIGTRMVGHYEQVAGVDTVGFVCSNDDWGFNTQTFLSPEHMRKYVFPWHKKIVEAAHRHGKPCILHSCGYFNDVIEDVIEDIGFDGRHSYEDKIMAVEDAYETYGHRIVIMGGMDMHFLATASPEEVYARSRAMLERTADRGNYVLGSGNSIPNYVPVQNFLAMTQAAHDMD